MARTCSMPKAFCLPKTTQNDIAIERETRGKQDNPKWVEFRTGCTKAENFKAVATWKGSRRHDPNILVKTLMKGSTEAEKNDCDNLPEKAQSVGTDSVEPIEQTLEGSSATGNFGALGGMLSTKSHGFTLHIPPGALEEDKKISLQVLTEIPNGLTLKEDELLASHGFQCYPSGLRFKKPAKLIIPHCALVTAPNKIQTILYSWDQSGTPKRLPDSSNFICSVQERWLEVSVSHFSGGFLVLIRNWFYLKGILLSCMPFLPRILPPSRMPILEVRFVKKPHHRKWTDVHALNNPYFQPVKENDDNIVFQMRTLTVACQLDEKSPRSDAIQWSEMNLKRKVTRYFPLDLTKESDVTSVTLELVQTFTKTIKFNTRFQGIDKEKTAKQDAASPPTDEIPSDEQEVTDACIMEIARLLPPNLWSPLYIALSIGYSTAEGIRVKSREITEHYIELLQIWKTTSTQTRKDLHAILNHVGAGGLVDKVTTDTEKNDYANRPEKAQSDGTDSVESINHAIGIDKEKTAKLNAASPPTDEIPSDEQVVTDANILNIASLLPPNLWSCLCVAVDIDYSTAEGIREQSRETTEQYIHLLQKWKTTSTRTRKDLNAILIQVEAGGLVDKYV